MGELLAILSLILFSVNIIVTKAASGRLDLNIGFLISLSINVLFSGMLFAIQLLVNDTPLEFSWFAFFMFMVSGLFATFLGRSFFFDSIARLGPAKASAFMVSTPLFTAIISWLFLGEVLSYSDIAAALLVLLGLFIISYIPGQWLKQRAADRNKPRMPFYKSAIVLALLGSLFYAMGNITRGTAIQHWNAPILGGFLGALVGVLLHVAFKQRVRSFISDLRASDQKGVCLYGLSGALTISAQIGQIASMHYIQISIATLITMSQPLLVIPLSYFLLKNEEGINRRTIIGSVIVLLGIAVIILD